MIKKLMSLLLTLCIFAPSVVFAQEKDTNDALQEEEIVAPKGAELLSALGFYIKDEYSDIVTREELAYSAAVLSGAEKCTSQNVYYTDVTSTQWKESIGSVVLGGYMVGAHGLFRPDDEATVGEAMTVFMRIAGFSDIVKTSADYLRYAQSYELLDGVSNDTNEKLTRYDLYRMLYNALFMPVVEITSIGEVSEYKINNEENILSSIHEIYEEEGIVTANEFTSISSASYRTGKGTIEIDDKIYSDKNGFGKKYIGYRALFYYRESNGEKNELLYLKPHKKTDTEEFDTDDLYILNNEIKTDTDGREKVIKISDFAIYIVNGSVASKDKAYGKIENFSGSVVFVDNDSDNVYDTVLVTAIELMWVKEKVNYEMRLVGDDGEELILDGRKDETITIYKNGAIADFSQIAHYDVLEIIRNDDSTVIDVYASSDRVLGKSTSAELEDRIVTIEEKEYKIPKSGLCDDYVQGKRGVFYISTSGYLVACEVFEYEYGYLLRALTNDEEEITIKVLNSLGEIEYIKIAEKCIYENTGNTLALGDVTGKKLIKYSVSAKGEVKKLSTAKTNTTGSYYDESGFTRDAFDTFRIRLTNPIIIGTNYSEKVYFINQQTVIFKVPEDEEAPDEDSRVISTGTLVNDMSIPFEVYDADNYGFARILVWKASSEEYPVETTSLFVLKRMYETVDEAGDVVLRFDGMLANKEVSYTVSDKLRSRCYLDGKASYKFGDVFQLKLDDSETVTQIVEIMTGTSKNNDWVKVTASGSELPAEHTPGGRINLFDDRCLMFGKARNVKSVELAMGIEINNPKYDLYHFVAMNKAVYTIVDFGEKQIKAGTANDIGDGSLVLARSRRQDVGDIIIFKDAR